MDRQKLLTELKILRDREYREEYQRSLVQIGVSAQIRALRGGMSQKEFADLIAVPQSVVSERLENPHYRGFNTATLVSIANALEIGLLVRFVSYPELLESTEDMSEAALRPPKLSESIDALNTDSRSFHFFSVADASKKTSRVAPKKRALKEHVNIVGGNAEVYSGALGAILTGIDGGSTWQDQKTSRARAATETFKQSQVTTFPALGLPRTRISIPTWSQVIWDPTTLR